MPYRTIKYSKKGHVARITLNRPAAGNAVNQLMVQEIDEAFGRLEDDERIYAVIVSGTGDVFCKFGEGERGKVPPAGAADIIARYGCPVIAAINGDAIGEGLEIALSCDIRIASDRARFGLPQVASGHIPADGGTQRLPRIVGRGKALELLLTADIITAAEALEMGLVSKVVPPEALEKEAEELAGAIAEKGPIALKYLKEAVLKGMDMTLEQGLRLEADLYFLLHTTADRTEGITAFREKRPPEFKER
jgi:enoyl-CoA hydratase/carnithine racemase